MLLVHCARAHSLSKQYSLFHMIIAFVDKEVQLFERYKEYLKKHGKLKSTAKTCGASVFFYTFTDIKKRFM